MPISRINIIRTMCASIMITILLTSAFALEPQPADNQTNVRPDIFDSAADAEMQITTALVKAKRENQRVLLMFGGNWCGWSHKLYHVFENDKQIAQLLHYEYQLVLVDIGRRDKHMDVALDYGTDLEANGVPFLTVLDADGKVLTNQETGSLEEGDHHDPQKVAVFLKKWKARPLDAQKLLANTLIRAVAERKTVFLHLGAPWCVWCYKLEAFLAQKDIAELFEQDFITLKIDMDRMVNAKRVAKRYRASEKSGIPWFAFIDAQGQTLITSDGPQGNIGYPVEPHEIEHFITMLKKAAQRITPKQIDQIQKALQERAAALKAATPQSQPTSAGSSGG